MSEYGRVATPKQKLAGRRNFDKMRVRGAVGTLLNMTTEFGVGDSELAFQLLALRQSLWDAIDLKYAREVDDESQEST